ncbi:PREDICTED: cholesterol 7-desaturase [Drosophila arizonae]|uniref:cholesterol 7-desaturase n=1 Tax=Drosophila arizonae TaxID=7263 RepID=A0ABM1Q4Z4_DROAR|nr:PREDICTED: cholesterol 7-desaturase [Drosophila arizonae]
MDFEKNNFLSFLYGLKSIIKYDQWLIILSHIDLKTIIVIASLIFLCGFLYWLAFVPLSWIKDIDQTGRGIKSNGKRAAINRLRKSRTIGVKELPPPYPNGWYGILESSNLSPGESTHVSCLGEQFAVFRTLQNEVFVVDAYCPHLGANLGIGGRVVGDNIECPFHHWRFRGTDGVCTSIPYSTCVPPATKIKKWISKEAHGYIFVWYSAEASELPWDIPESKEVENKTIVYQGRNEFHVRCHIQEIPENGADLAHFRAIHNDNIITGTSDQKHSIFSWLGYHQWQASWSPSEAKHIGEIQMSHVFELFGKFKCFQMTIIGKQIGPAYVHLTLHSPSIGSFQIFQTVTPVEPLLQKVVHRFYGNPKITALMKFLIFGETVMFERDMNLWNHKMYRSNPLLVAEESPLKKFRKWYSQFYSDNSKSFQSANSQDW